jgi:hypothetical protein
MPLGIDDLRPQRRQPDEPQKPTLEGCARCGEDHHIENWQKFDRPVELESEAPLTHWAICPTSGQPILMRITDDGKGEA